MGAFASPAIAEFPRDVEIALRRLPPHTQREVLARVGANFQDRRFVPMLERFARTGGPDGPSDPAVQILNEIAPSVARRIVRADLARPADPRLGFETTRVLPDRTLPALDAVFLRQLRRAPNVVEFAAAMDRVERFASASIAKEVERAYVRQPQGRLWEIAVPAAAFFFRTDPAFARQELGRVWTSMQADDHRREKIAESGLFGSIAATRTSRALEDAALVALAGRDAVLAADAAGMLGTYGTARAESALWAAWDSVHRRSTYPALQSNQDEKLERRLRLALELAGGAWTRATTIA
jgi:hypothetical protein